MSQENVEIVKRAYADPRGMAAAAGDRVARDAVFDFTAVYPDRPVVRGVREARRLRAEGPWAELRFEPERFIDVDDERVLVFVKMTGVGEKSGVPAEGATAHEFTIRDGLLIRFKVYADRATALEAAGLSE